MKCFCVRLVVNALCGGRPDPAWDDGWIKEEAFNRATSPWEEFGMLDGWQVTLGREGGVSQSPGQSLGDFDQAGAVCAGRAAAFRYLWVHGASGTLFQYGHRKSVDEVGAVPSSGGVRQGGSPSPVTHLI